MSVRLQPNTMLPPGSQHANEERPIRPTSTGPRKSRLLIWIIVTILVILGVVYFWNRHSADEAQASKKGKGAGLVIPVLAAKAVKGDIGVYFTGLGSVTPLYTVTVKTRVDGQLMQVLFTEGQMVKEGDLLVEIDPRPYQVQLDQAEGQLIRDQAALKNAQVDLERYQELWKQDSIPEQTLATQQALVDQDEGVIKSDQAAIDSAKLNLVYCHITSPINGRVGLRLVDPGNIVHATDTTGLLVITQIQPITVVFTIPEDDVPPVMQRLNRGEKLEVDAYDRAMKTKLAEGALLTADNEIDPTTGTLKLKALFPNQDNALFPNQFVNTRLLVETKQGVVLVPNAAIQRGTQATFVYIVKPDQTVASKNITTGTSEGDVTEIQSGVEPGDTVVTDGVDKLQEGSKVNVHLKN